MKEELDYMIIVPYPSVIGRLMYAMVCTRLDISYAIGIVSRCVVKPVLPLGGNIEMVVEILERRFEHYSACASRKIV